MCPSLAVVCYTGVEVIVTKVERAVPSMLRSSDGNTADVSGNDFRIEMTALRQFDLVAGGAYMRKESNAGFWVGRVRWCDDPDAELAINQQLVGTQAANLRELVVRWTELLTYGCHEAYENQLRVIVDGLGPLPDPRERPGAVALWVGSLINAQPPFGRLDAPIASEVRPALLKAITAAQRVAIATEAIKASITSMEQMANQD